MAMKLVSENVRRIEQNLLNELEIYGAEGKEAEKMLHYICGIHDMANAVIQGIIELGGY